MNLSETSEVLSAIAALRKGGRQMALATIVSIKGSTYRRPGARLLVPDEGEPTGNLSGGCLEGQVTEISRDVMSSGEPRLEFYDLTADDEVVWGWGLGCNGAIEVFIEPADRAAESADALNKAIREERSLASATVIESEAAPVSRGRRLLVYPSGERDGTLGDDSLDDSVASRCEELFGNGGTEILSLRAEGGRVRVFVEVLEPPLRLLVCGAGHDAIPLVRQASALGWRVEVVDDRASFLDQDRFAGASGFVECNPEEVASAAKVDGRTYAIVMSHNFLRDRDYLRSLLGSGVAYIGMLGPRARLERILDELRTDGVTPTKEELARVHGPAGLDIGAEGPEEVAAAIVGEVLAVRTNRNAGFLRGRAGPIHERPQSERV